VSEVAVPWGVHWFDKSHLAWEYQCVVRLAAVRLRRRLVLVICLLAIAIPPSTAYAWSYIVTYGGPEITLYHYEWRATPHEKFREFNRIYRTLWYEPNDTADKASLFYGGGGPNVTSYANDNPFTDQRDSPGAQKAGCQNVVPYEFPLYNVTCQTTHP
jgi:hypothetical protein